jgi:hypothetical protein
VHVEKACRKTECLHRGGLLRFGVGAHAFHPAGLKDKVGREGFAAQLLDLVHGDRQQGIGVGHRAMRAVESPKRSHQADGLTRSLELKTIADPSETHLGGSGGQPAPAKVVGRDQRAGIGEIATGQGSDRFLPLRRG